MCATNKMNWFIEDYNNGNLEYTIANTGANFGTVVMPTGTGKSGKVYEDICRILDSHKKGEKVVINISCPILKLTQQFINDLFAVASEIYKGKKEFRFFINSSDSGKMYDDALRGMEVDVENFRSFEKKFVDNPNADIAIVASCHKSLYKFVNKMHKLSDKHMEVVTYIDEAHLIDIHPHNEDEEAEVIYVDLDKLCKASTKVYALTATPDPEVVKKLNDYNAKLMGTGKYIYQMRPVEAINKNMILPPLMKYVQVDMEKTDKISAGMLRSFMAEAKSENPRIAHKMLVTLKSANQLKELRKELEKLGYTVFSTCSQFGFNAGDDEDEVDYYEGDVTKFIADVDNYNGDCFVLHIKQLIQGIDIKSLTDCVIWNNQHGAQGHYRHTIQVIGRILRPLMGERGMDKSERLKKVGRVYFVCPQDDEKVMYVMQNFLCRYYGFDNITFETKRYGSAGMEDEDLFDDFKDVNFRTSWDNPEIQTLMTNIEEYIKTKLLPKAKLYKMMNKKIDLLGEANKILSEYDALGKEWDSSELLDNKDLLEKIGSMFETYQIEGDSYKLF